MQDLVTTLDARIASHHDELVAFLRRRTSADPESLAQEVWLRIHRAGPELADESAFRAYMFTVARRLVIDAHRRRAARIQLVAVDGVTLERFAGAALSPDLHVEAGEVLAVVLAELDAMSPEMAEVFRWRVLDDVPFKEIARRQGCPVNTALARMHRATKKLASALSEAGLAGDQP